MIVNKVWIGFNVIILKGVTIEKELLLLRGQLLQKMYPHGLLLLVTQQ